MKKNYILKNVRLSFFSIVIVFTLILLSCIKNNPIKQKECPVKDQICDSALLILENKTAKTIYFNRGGYDNQNPYPFSIKPSEILTFKTGNVEVHFNKDCHETGTKSTNIQSIGTTRMYYSVTMDRCTKHASFITENNDYKLEVED